MSHIRITKRYSVAQVYKMFHAGVIVTLGINYKPTPTPMSWGWLTGLRAERKPQHKGAWHSKLTSAIASNELGVLDWQCN